MEANREEECAKLCINAAKMKYIMEQLKKVKGYASLSNDDLDHSCYHCRKLADLTKRISETSLAVGITDENPDFALAVVQAYMAIEDKFGEIGLGFAIEVEKGLQLLLPGYSHLAYDTAGEPTLVGVLSQDDRDWLWARHFNNRFTAEAKNAALADVRLNCEHLLYLPENLQEDLDVVVAAIEEDSEALVFVRDGQLDDLHFLQGLFSRVPHLRLCDEVCARSQLAQDIKDSANSFYVSQSEYALSRPPKLVTVHSIDGPDSDGCCTLRMTFMLGVEGPEEEVDFNLGDVNWYTTRALREHLAQNVFQTEIDDFQITLGHSVLAARQRKYDTPLSILGTRTDEATLIDPVDPMWRPYFFARPRASSCPAVRGVHRVSEVRPRAESL